MNREKKEIGPEQVQVPSVTPAKEPEANKQNILLKALEALGEYQSLGLEKRNFFEELRYLEAEAKYHAESLGQVKKKEKAIRDIVRNLREVDGIVDSHGYKKSALLQILLDIQRQLNWLPRLFSG